jgi:hypothetical protein
MTMVLKPTVLILGATGQIGSFILEHLKRQPDAVHIRLTLISERGQPAVRQVSRALAARLHYTFRDLARSPHTSPGQQDGVRFADSQNESGLPGENEVALKIDCSSLWDADNRWSHSNIPAFLPAK